MYTRSRLEVRIGNGEGGGRISMGEVGIGEGDWRIR